MSHAYDIRRQFEFIIQMKRSNEALESPACCVLLSVISFPSHQTERTEPFSVPKANEGSDRSLALVCNRTS